MWHCNPRVVTAILLLKDATSIELPSYDTSGDTHCLRRHAISHEHDIEY